MGKRQIGELQPFELVLTVMISELASLPMQDTRIPISHTIIPIVTLLILEIITALLELKSEKARLLICGKPSILISHGKIDVDELRSQKLNINDLLEELRLKDYFDIAEIEYAILETSGQLSIIPKSDAEPATRKDLKVYKSQAQLPITLILDGKINAKNLHASSKDSNWLKQQLKLNNISSPQEVFIGVLDSNGKFFYQLRNTAKKL